VTGEHLPDDRAALLARMFDLVDDLTDPEAVEVRSLLDAIARHHGLDWTRQGYVRRGNDKPSGQMIQLRWPLP
jgi:hypothetical protein